MVLIISNKEDYTTSKVIKWLYYFKQSFLRLNEDSIIKSTSIKSEHNNNTVVFNYKNQSVSLDSISSYWYRRGKLKFDNSLNNQHIQINKELQHSLERLMKEETEVVENLFYEELEKKRSIGNFHKNGLNKLITLNQAKECGLLIPDTLVSSEKKELTFFLKKYKKIICKPIFEVPLFKDEENDIQIYTSLINEELLDTIPDTFFPSLFQKHIEKKYEIRTFFLNGKCYSNAIFSQLDNESKVDWRNGKNSLYNRRVPFNLPKPIETKLSLLMNKVGLNCGSIDFIVTPEGNYYFLEINPIGQFGMTSYIANYNLEKKVANYLMNG